MNFELFSSEEKLFKIYRLYVFLKIASSKIDRLFLENKSYSLKQINCLSTVFDFLTINVGG